MTYRAWSYGEFYDHSDSEELFDLSDKLGGFKKNDFVGDVTGGRRQDVSVPFPGCYEKCFYKYALKVFSMKTEFYFYSGFPLLC